MRRPGVLCYMLYVYVYFTIPRSDSENNNCYFACKLNNKHWSKKRENNRFRFKQLRQ